MCCAIPLAGTTADCLIAGIRELTGGAIEGRFFHFYPPRDVNLHSWLAQWIRRGRTLGTFTPSIRALILVRAPDRVLFTLHPRLGSEVIRGHVTILVACSSGHVNRRHWACAVHNLRWTRTSSSEEIATCNDARTRTSETKISDTDSDQCKHKTSIYLFWLHPSSDLDAWTEISDVM